MTRQGEWRRKMKALGNCVQCAKPKDRPDRICCEPCRKKAKSLSRAYYRPMREIRKHRTKPEIHSQRIWIGMNLIGMNRIPYE